MKQGEAEKDALGLRSGLYIYVDSPERAEIIDTQILTLLLDERGQLPNVLVPQACATATERGLLCFSNIRDALCRFCILMLRQNFRLAGFESTTPGPR